MSLHLPLKTCVGETPAGHNTATAYLPIDNLVPSSLVAGTATCTCVAEAVRRKRYLLLSSISHLPYPHSRVEVLKLPVVMLKEHQVRNLN